MTQASSVRAHRSRCRAVLTAAGAGLLAMVGCASTTASSEVSGGWRIEQAQREPILDRREARIVFGPDGRMTGHTSCNAMSGSYVLEGPALKLGPVVTTRKGCPRLLLEQEDRILTALEHAVDARVRPDGLLELRDADGRGVLRGSRLDGKQD